MPSPAIRITELLVFYLPVVETLAVFGVIAALTAYLFRVRFSSRRRLQVCLRVVGAFLVLPLIVVFIVMVSMAFGSRPKVFVSPDSQHVAEYSYDPGFLGRDITVVRVRRKWSILPADAYVYDGPSDWEGTEVRWLSSDQLSIRYHLDRDRFQKCKTNAAGILVQCVPLTK